MPNWCETTLKIMPNEGVSVKQMKKIFKRITGDKDYYDAIVDIAYDDLFYLDRVNEYFSKDPQRVDIANMILEYLAIKEKIEPMTIDEVIKGLYHIIKTNTQEWYSLPIMTDDLDNIPIIATVTDLYKAYVKNKDNEQKQNEEKEIDEYRDSDCPSLKELNALKILPDNPLSLYRMNYMNKHSILEKDDISMGTHVDSWYNSRCDTRIGTKWNPQTATSSFDDETGVIRFDLNCAWGPCIEMAKVITDMYDVTICIGYFEGGVGFAGKTFIQDGEIIDEVSYDDELSNDYMSSFYYRDLAIYDNPSDIDYIDLLDALNTAIDWSDDINFNIYEDLTPDNLSKYMSRKVTRKKILKFIDNTTIPEDVKEDFKGYLLSFRDKKKEKKMKVISINKKK